MFEKVNPAHPDKVADRIAGAIVDLAYKAADNPKIAVEVLIGHGVCHIIVEESGVVVDFNDVKAAVKRIAGEEVRVDFVPHRQNDSLAGNQVGKIRCGDNGIFKGCPTPLEEKRLTEIVKRIYEKYPYDGKYIVRSYKDAIKGVIACQSHVSDEDILPILKEYFDEDRIVINPLGPWTGGTDVDTGATNRKLGSDMGGAVTGGGLHGKDLSKADVSVNIYAHIRAQQLGSTIGFNCAIGDEYVDGLPYAAIVEIARDYVFNVCGGFEKLAEWGLIR